ncbi:MAG: aromatic amino acid lyase [Acidimicrobiales bacterium]
MTVVLDGAGLSLLDLAAVARDGEQVALSPEAREQMLASRQVVEEALAREEPVYGLTTGVGERKRAFVSSADRLRFNRELVSSHRVAQGKVAPRDVVRGAMLCLANGLAKGAAGVRPQLVEMLVSLLNEGYVASVRRLGSVGEADLGAMADLAHGMLEHTGFELAANEGLALLSNNAFATAWSGLQLVDTAQMLSTLDVAAALDLEAFAANVTALHPIIAETRMYLGLGSTIERLRVLLEGSYLFKANAARNLQDPLTFRCIPQVHGGARDTISYARSVLETELNSSQGNPVVVLAERRVVSVGNFDAGQLAAALDFVRIALAPVVTSANERAVKLLQAPFSGLASGLTAEPGTAATGLAELAILVQSLAVEARTLAHPVSYELASSTKGEGIEDRTTMAPLSARRLADMLDLTARVVAIELVVACQAVDLRQARPLGTGTTHAYLAVRELVPFTATDSAFPADLEPVVELVKSGGIDVPAEKRSRL